MAILPWPIKKFHWINLLPVVPVPLHFAVFVRGSDAGPAALSYRVSWKVQTYLLLPLPVLRLPFYLAVLVTA